MGEDLRKIVDEATPGPWRYEGHDEGYDSVKAGYPAVWTVCDALDRGPADATFIATFDPLLVSALLDVAEAARLRRTCRSCAMCDTDPPLRAALERLAGVSP